MNELWAPSLKERLALWEANKKSAFVGCIQVTHWTDLVTWTDDDMTEEQIHSILGFHIPSNAIKARSLMNGAWNANERLTYVAYKSVLKKLEGSNVKI